METEILSRAWADVDYNDKGIYLVTRSGYRMAALDDDGVRRFLPRSASNKMLGEALIACLSASRVVPAEEWNAFFDWRDADRRGIEYEKWQFAVSGHKTRVAFSKYLMMCKVEVVGSTIYTYSLRLWTQLHQKVSAGARKTPAM